MLDVELIAAVNTHLPTNVLPPGMKSEAWGALD